MDKNMCRSIAYIRVSTDKQTEMNQHHEIEKYCSVHNINVSKTISLTISSRKSSEERGIDELREELFTGDQLIVSELSRLGRSIVEVISLIEYLLKEGVVIHLIKQGLVLRDNDSQSTMAVTQWSLMAQLERDFISMRTKEALKLRKANGVKLGNPQNATVDGRLKGLSQGTKVRQENALLFARKVNKFIIKARDNGAVTLRQIADFLNGEGIKTRRGAQWTSTAVKRIADNVSFNCE